MSWTAGATDAWGAADAGGVDTIAGADMAWGVVDNSGGCTVDVLDGDGDGRDCYNCGETG